MSSAQSLSNREWVLLFNIVQVVQGKGNARSFDQTSHEHFKGQRMNTFVGGKRNRGSLVQCTILFDTFASVLYETRRMNIVVANENMSLLDQTCQGYFLLMKNVVGKGNMRLLGQTHQFNIFSST